VPVRKNRNIVEEARTGDIPKQTWIEAVKQETVVAKCKTWL